MHLLNFVELRSVRTTSAFVVCFHSIQYPLGVYWVSCICRYMSSKGGILVLYDVTVAMLLEIKAYPLGIEFIICWISFFSEMSMEKSTLNSSLVVKRGCAFPMSLLWGVTISFVCLFFVFFWIWSLGAHYRSGNAAGTEQDFEVERIINHESYRRPRGLAHDISLLKLSKPAQLTSAVGMACLPESSNSLTEIDGKNCWVTGKVIL